MKVLKVIGIIVIVILLIIVIVGIIAPKMYSVERSITIDSPKELVFNHIKYWRNWRNWSPWTANDPKMQVTIEGKDGEEGSIYKWIGDPKITGKGEMTNTGVKDYEELSYHLHFMEPWESESDGYVRVADADGGTKVSWGFYGETPIPWNIVMLFVSMDKMVGKDFEQGLVLMKELCEKEAKAVLSYEVKRIKFKAKKYATIQKEVAMSEIKSFFTESFGTIDQARRKKGARIVGATAGLYYSWDKQNQIKDMAAAVPVSRLVNVGEVKSITLPAAEAYSIEYYGPYSEMAPVYNALDLYLLKNGLKRKPPFIEEYITDQETEPDSSKWLTKVYYFVE